MISDELMDKTLEKINKTPVAYSYFFNSINSPAWLLPLKEKGFFTTPPPAIREDGYIQFPVWPESGYLLRIADKAPDEVLDIIKSLPSTDNERVMDDIVNILLKIDVVKVFRMTETVKKYTNSSQFLLLHQAASQFICKLADGGYDRPALGLAREMLEVLPDPKKDEKLESNYVMIKPTTKYRDHDYKDVVEKITPSLVKAAPLATIDMYADLLQKAIDYELTFFKEDGEKVALKEKVDDFSFISRPNIAEDNEYGDDPDDILTTALRDSVVILMQDDSISDLDKLAKLKQLAVNKYSIFKRIVEFGLRNYKDVRAFRLFYDSLISDKKLKSILEGEKNGVGKVRSGIVTEKPTKVLEGLSDVDLIEKLKTYKDETGWLFERDSVAKELGQLVKTNPERFASLLKELATTKNEYLNEAIQAFEEVIDDLDENITANILVDLAEIYQTNNELEESEQHDYYSWSKASSLRLVEKLAGKKEDKTERMTNKSLDAAIKLVLLLCRDGDPVDKSDSNFEPVDLSINSNRGNALHATAYLLAWMNRSKANKAQYKLIFDELDWHLSPKNDPSAAMRAVYGWRFEVLYGADEDWATRNIDVIFSDDKLGKAAFDAYVMFNRVHEDALRILGNVFKRQLPRLAAPPDDKTKARHDGLKSFTQHLALHYWYTDMDVSKNSMMTTLLKTADKTYIKELANFIGFRLYKSKGEKTEEAHIKKLSELWEAIVDLTKKDDSKLEALEEFGTWFASGKFDPKWSLEQLTYVSSKAGKIHLDFAALEYMEKLVERYPMESLKALSAMVDGAKERWAVSSWNKNATAIIKNAYTSSDDTVKQLAIDLANKLVAKGYTEYRNVVKGS
ncbi:MAG TPA: hypothetical protein VGE34_00875 [Candidatus Saccharimonadales bacterium]